MGADVYLQSVSQKVQAKWQPVFDAAVAERAKYPRDSEAARQAQQKVTEAYNSMYAEGYFRDCYNEYGLFANLTPSLSWWRDVGPMLDDESFLPIPQAKTLRERVATATIDLTNARAVARQQKDADPTLAEYEKWQKELLAILDMSIRFGEPLYMSL